MANILIIGGAGYIGSHTVIELIHSGHDPVVVDNFSNSTPGVLARLNDLAGRDILFHELDFRNTSGLQNIIESENIEAVIHFAAYKAVGESVTDPLKYYQNNTAGFADLLRTLTDSGVRTVIFSSTAAVYGNPPEEAVTEETPCRPESPYGWSKYMDEIILRDTCAAMPELKGIALRYFNVVGSHESGRIGESSKSSPQNLLPIIVQATAKITPPFTVYGTDYPTADGTCLRDYIHVSDLAQAHVAALDNALEVEGGSFRAYNIGTGKPTSVLQLIKTFESVNDVQVPYAVGDRRAGDPTAYYALADKAEGELGWKASKTIEDACRDAWHWQTANPDGYR